MSIWFVFAQFLSFKFYKDGEFPKLKAQTLQRRRVFFMYNLMLLFLYTLYIVRKCVVKLYRNFKNESNHNNVLNIIFDDQGRLKLHEKV